MAVISKLVERFRSRVLLAVQVTGGGGAQAYLTPTGGTQGITLRTVATMGNAADLALSLKYADDAAGTNATAWPVNVPIYVNGVREAANAKEYTITPATGNFIVDFIVDPATVPQGKFVGLSYGNSHNSTLMTALMIEDVAYRPTAT